MSARCAPRPSAPATAPTASPGRRSSSPMASTTSPTTSSTSCWRGCPMRRAGTKGISLFLVPKFLLNADGSLGERNDVRCAFDRAQARHPRLADLHHGLWRQGRRDRLADRRGEPRPRLHVHDDEQRAARRRPAGRRHRRARDAAGARLCARPQAGPRAGANGSSPIIEHPDVQAHAADHARADRAPRARSATPPRVAIDRAHRSKDDAARKAAQRARLAADAGRQGLLHRHRHRGRLARRAGAWRHGLHRGDRRGAALSRRAHRRDLRRHQRHPGDRSGDAQAAAVGRRRPCAAYIGELRDTVDGGAGEPTIRPSARPARGCGDAVDSLERATDWLLGAARQTTAGRARRRDAVSAAVRQRRRRLHAGRRGARRAAARRRRAARRAHRAGALLRREHRRAGGGPRTHRHRRRRQHQHAPTPR